MQPINNVRARTVVDDSHIFSWAVQASFARLSARVAEPNPASRDTPTGHPWRLRTPARGSSRSAHRSESDESATIAVRDLDTALIASSDIIGRYHRPIPSAIGRNDYSLVRQFGNLAGAGARPRGIARRAELHTRAVAVLAVRRLTPMAAAPAVDRA
jgi:hypothetical protein